MVFSNKNFDEIIKFYDLGRAVSFYKIFNKTKYINSYHGWNHVKNVVSSLQEVIIHYHDDPTFRNVNFRNMFIALIFHDFGYVSCGKVGSNYDAQNIEAALYGAHLFTEMENIDITIANEIFEFIKATEYPRIDNHHIPSLIQDIILDVDHSMPLFKNYPAMGYNLLTQEFGCKDYNQYMTAAADYLPKLTFKLPYFQELWSGVRSQVIENVTTLINDMHHKENKLQQSITHYTEFEII